VLPESAATTLRALERYTAREERLGRFVVGKREGLYVQQSLLVHRGALARGIKRLDFHLELLDPLLRSGASHPSSDRL
jgi:hypothetical protein